MAVYRDKTKTWRYRKQLRIGTTTQRISGTPLLNTRQAAERAEREHIHRLLNPEYLIQPVVFPVETFATFAQQWLATHCPAANKRSTETFREGHIRLYLTPRLGDLPLDQITNLRLVQLVAELRVTPKVRGEGSLGAQTVKGVMSTLRKILHSAVDWGKLTAVPKFPKVKAPKAEWDWLQREESEALQSVVTDPEDRAMLLFALHTGCRQGEQLAVEWSDVKAGQVTFRRGIYRGVESDTKTGRERTVDLSPRLKEALQAIRHLRGRKVFCDQDGRPLKPSELAKRLSRYLKASGLRAAHPRFTWHDLRHSFASQLVSAGAPLAYIQQALGHASIQTTMIYAHLAPSVGRRIIALLEPSERTAHEARSEHSVHS